VRLRKVLAAVLLAGPLVLAGCGGEEVESGGADSVVQEGGEGAEQPEDEDDD
jgi:hypothetical protein